MSDNAILEISQMMQDKANLQSDMDEVFKTVNDMFKRKYLNKLHKAIQSQQLRTKENPPKEAQLVNAMKAFAHEDVHPAYDRMIDMLLTADTFKKMSANLRTIGVQAVSENQNTTSIHSDGIYDIDNTCLASKNNANSGYMGIFLVMSMLNNIKK